MRTLIFEYEPVEGATRYDFEFRKLGTTELLKNFSQKDAEVEITLPFDKYEFRQRTADKRKVAGDWSPWEKFDVAVPEIKIVNPVTGSSINSSEGITKKVKLNWTGGESVEEFEIKIVDLGKKTEIEKFTTKNRETEVQLPVAAAYEVLITAVVGETVPAELISSATTQFSLVAKELNDPQIIPILSSYSQKITWKPVEFATSYDATLELYSTARKKWETVSTQNNITTSELAFDPSWSGGSYRLKVAANGNLRKRSPASIEKFRLAKVRSPTAEYNSLLFKAIDRVDGYLTQVSWLVTQMNLSSFEFETASAINARLIGGTVRAGLGYFKMGKPWGVVGYLNASRIILNGANNDFTNYDINGMYRKKFVSRDELRLSLGVSQKQIPVIVSENSSSAFRIHNANVLGPRLAVEYWYGLSPKWGLQANYNLNFYNLVENTSAPNGKMMKLPQSFQAGLLTSYQFSDRIAGLIGITRQEDLYQYEALTTGVLQPVAPGSVNSGFLKANYIGLMVEIGL